MISGLLEMLNKLILEPDQENDWLIRTPEPKTRSTPDNIHGQIARRIRIGIIRTPVCVQEVLLTVNKTVKHLVHFRLFLYLQSLY